MSDTFDPSRPPAQPADDARITEADLHGYVDRQLGAERRTQVEAYLAAQPDERARVDAWQRHRAMLHALLDPVLDEVLPPSLLARRGLAPRVAWRALAAGVVIAALSAALAWTARGAVDRRTTEAVASGDARSNTLSGFALRAAVAHAVYTPEVRRPVEVAADQEQQLVTWLSKRLGTPIHAPGLKQVGYELIGGRLLPGDSGPVAQFMYHDATGQRLTLYVTREPPKVEGTVPTAFRFGHDGSVNVFYWVDKDFGYALSSSADRQELTRVAHEVYRQLGGS
jgi:anti-sigma factor RsiW